MLAATHDRPRRSLRRRGPLLAGLVGLVLVLAGCSRPGQVKDFNEQTQENFQLSCEEANDGSMNDAEVAETCRCWYDVVSGPDGMSFDDFKAEDENIREAIDADRLNNEDDFRREAPRLFDIVTENCLPESGPQAG